MNEQLLTLARLARRLGVTQHWLREEADAGRIPCLRAGNRYLFSLEAMDNALAERASQCSPEFAAGKEDRGNGT